MGIGIYQLLAVILFLLIPTFIAVIRNHPQKNMICLINIFGVWLFGLGWFVALIWCFSDKLRLNKLKTTT